MSEIIGVHFNPSTLLAQYDDENKKLIVSSYEYGNDCCCFLDPATVIWSALTTYNLGGIVQRAGSGIFRSKADGNLNHQPPNTTWWTQLTTINPCNNTDWNKYPGYGGIGKTPKYMTIEFSGIGGDGGENGWPLSGPNRKFIATQAYWSGSYCYYTCQTKPKPEGGYAVFVHLYNSYCFVELFSKWVFARWINGFYYLTNTYIWVGSSDAAFRCKQNHTSSPANQPPNNSYWEDIGEMANYVNKVAFAYWNGLPDCSLLGTTLENQADEDYEGFFAEGHAGCCEGEEPPYPCQGTAIVTPGKKILVYSWVSNHLYSIGDMVYGTDNDVYICKLGHTSTINDRPITGANWSTYWVLAGDYCL